MTIYQVQARFRMQDHLCNVHKNGVSNPQFFSESYPPVLQFDGKTGAYLVSAIIDQDGDHGHFQCPECDHTEAF